MCSRLGLGQQALDSVCSRTQQQGLNSSGQARVWARHTQSMLRAWCTKVYLCNLPAEEHKWMPIVNGVVEKGLLPCERMHASRHVCPLCRAAARPGITAVGVSRLDGRTAKRQLYRTLNACGHPHRYFFPSVLPTPDIFTAQSFRACRVGTGARSGRSVRDHTHLGGARVGVAGRCH